MRGWASGEIARHDWLRIVQAGREIGHFDSRRWIRNLDIPAAVVVTVDDELVPPVRQLALAGAIPGATIHEASGGHAACINLPEMWLPAFASGLGSVFARLGDSA